MADLIAIGYDDETTAARAEQEVERLVDDLIIQPDAVAVIVRDTKGKAEAELQDALHGKEQAVTT